MPYVTPETVIAGTTTSAAKFNKLVADILELWKGAAAGDIDYYTSATLKARLAIVAHKFLRGNAAGNAIEYGGLEVAAAEQNYAMTIPNSVSTVVTFNAEAIDTAAFINLGTYNNRITIPAGLRGYYLVGGNCANISSAYAGYLKVCVVKNSGAAIADQWQGVVSTGIGRANCMNFVSLNAADYLQLCIEQNSGGNQDFKGTLYAALLCSW